MLRQLTGSDIRFDTRLAEPPPHLRADPVQIQQVLLNLVINGRDAMPGGGQLLLQTRSVSLREEDLHIYPDLKAGSYVELSVRDTGVGIPPEVLPHFFEPFFTTKDGSNGTGLGLATTYGIVRQSGGFISVSSDAGCGSLFCVYFPAVPAPEPVAEPPRQTLPVSRGSETVLLVEDEDSLRELIQQGLQARGYQVLTASSAENALRVFTDHNGSIELLLSDVVMPGLSGPELAFRLSSQRPELRTLFISGFTRDALSRQGIAEPGVALLQKPFSQSALHAKVREVLDGPAAFALAELVPQPQ